MLFKTAATLMTLLPGFAAAQYGYGAPADSGSTSTSAAPAAAPSGQINVADGGNFVFSPANVTASNGTIVNFIFPNPGAGISHSVTQSSFASPCTYLAASSNNSAGFDSGLTAGTTFSITITDDTKPIWFHCKFPTHCGFGMVGSINAPSTGNTHDAFVAAAMAIGSNEATETDNGPVTGGFGAVATAAPATSSPASGGSSGGSGGSGNGALRTGVNLAVTLFAVAIAVSLA
ncbi:hypothetical protein ONZ45_g14673 [Pleurotus djamor]|nr:hypothetical protein ONZ45_g14673 [Pleurotus djamor]